MQELFAIKNTYDDRMYSLKISFIEIYNENIRDLIADSHAVAN